MYAPQKHKTAAVWPGIIGFGNIKEINEAHKHLRVDQIDLTLVYKFEKLTSPAKFPALLAFGKMFHVRGRRWRRHS